MEIKTKDFGVLDIDEKEIIRFPQGLFAFEECHNFVLIEMDGYKQKWLQSVDAEYPRFIVFAPADLVANYHPQFPPEVLNSLGIPPLDKPLLYVLAVVPENIKDMTINLKSPIVVNQKKNIAAQVILETGNYPVRYRVFPQEKGGV